MDDPQILTFEPWSDPTIDTYDQHPEGTLSRLAWLPTIGPTAWLLWGTVATQLRREAEVHWELGALAQALGVSPANGPNGVIRRTITRLERFRLLSTIEDNRYLLRLCAPPLRPSQLQRLPGPVVELHHLRFPGRGHQRVG